MPAAVRDDDYSACGTDRGRARHRKRGEEPCPPCHEAHLAYCRSWYQRNKARLKRRRVRAEQQSAA